MNNQFTGSGAWNDCLTALEQATPVIEAIAVTDYYVTERTGGFDSADRDAARRACGDVGALGRQRPDAGQVQVEDGTTFALSQHLHALADPERASFAGRVGAGITDLLMNALTRQRGAPHEGESEDWLRPSTLRGTGDRL